MAGIRARNLRVIALEKTPSHAKDLTQWLSNALIFAFYLPLRGQRWFLTNFPFNLWLLAKAPRTELV